MRASRTQPVAAPNVSPFSIPPAPRGGTLDRRTLVHAVSSPPVTVRPNTTGAAARRRLFNAAETTVPSVKASHQSVDCPAFITNNNVSAAPVAVPRSSGIAIAVSSRDRNNTLCRQRSGGSSSSDGKPPDATKLYRSKEQAESATGHSREMNPARSHRRAHTSCASKSPTSPRAAAQSVAVSNTSSPLERSLAPKQKQDQERSLRKPRSASMGSISDAQRNNFLYHHQDTSVLGGASAGLSSRSQQPTGRTSGTAGRRSSAIAGIRMDEEIKSPRRRQRSGRFKTTTIADRSVYEYEFDDGNGLGIEAPTTPTQLDGGGSSEEFAEDIHDDNWPSPWEKNPHENESEPVVHKQRREKRRQKTNPAAAAASTVLIPRGRLQEPPPKTPMSVPRRSASLQPVPTSTGAMSHSRRGERTAFKGDGSTRVSRSISGQNVTGEFVLTPGGTTTKEINLTPSSHARTPLVPNGMDSATLSAAKARKLARSKSMGCTESPVATSFPLLSPLSAKSQSSISARTARKEHASNSGRSHRSSTSRESKGSGELNIVQKSKEPLEQMPPQVDTIVRDFDQLSSHKNNISILEAKVPRRTTSGRTPRTRRPTASAVGTIAGASPSVPTKSLVHHMTRQNRRGSTGAGSVMSSLSRINRRSSTGFVGGDINGDVQSVMTSLSRIQSTRSQDESPITQDGNLPAINW
jgi:hypothetical protein